MSQIEIYQLADYQTQIEVKLDVESVWLTQQQMSGLFEKSKKTISEHILNIFKEGELDEISVVRNFRTTATDGKSYEVSHYNLDVIISVGYRVKSKRGTQFRQWATQRNPIAALIPILAEVTSSAHIQLLKMIKQGGT